MTAVSVTSRQHVARHARTATEGRPPLRKRIRSAVSVKIPKAVDAAITWSGKNRLIASCLLVTVVTIVVAVAMSAYWLPAITGLGGITIGAVLTRIADNSLIEENRRLVAENAGLRVKAVSPVDTSDSVETLWIRRIGDER